MPDEQPKQKTGKGHEIPIPTRGEFFRDLGKVARPPAKSDRKRRPKK